MMIILKKEIIFNNNTPHLRKIFLKSCYKKIILTTDLDLIKDGVQYIDDRVFIKNPSCDEVEVDIKSVFDKRHLHNTIYGGNYLNRTFTSGYLVVRVWKNVIVVNPLKLKRQDIINNRVLSQLYNGQGLKN
jgi:hypothetical protein